MPPETLHEKKAVARTAAAGRGSKRKVRESVAAL